MSGGSSSKKVTLPKFYERGLQQQIGMARDAAGTGYVPYYGPDVAAFSPMQEAAFQGTELMADAFGMPSNQGMQYMPAPQQFEGGAMGYSSAPIFEGAQDALATNNPGQFDYINSFTIDPVTGARGSRMAASQPVKLEMTAPRKRGKRG